jgi:hypothetical protein
VRWQGGRRPAGRRQRGRRTGTGDLIRNLQVLVLLW